jgi:hypothetical protein
MGVHFMGVHLMGVHLSWACISHGRASLIGVHLS